jgi:hypothetical protein
MLEGQNKTTTIDASNVSYAVLAAQQAAPHLQAAHDVARLAALAGHQQLADQPLLLLLAGLARRAAATISRMDSTQVSQQF